MPAKPRIASALAFIGTFSVLLYYALRGGSYDIVARQEETIAVWWALGLGWASGVLPRYRRPRSSALPLLALAGLALWTAASLTWTSSDSRTLAEVVRVLHYAGLIVLVWSLFGEDTWRAAAAGLVAAAVVVCALSVANRLVPGAFPANRIKGVFGTNRLNYPFNYWNAVACWSAMTFAMVLAVSVYSRRAWVRALCVAAIPLCGLAAYLTYARQGILGFGVALLAVLVLSRSRWTVLAHTLAGAAGATLAVLVARGQPAIVQATSGAGGAKVLLALLAGMAGAGVAAALTRASPIDRLRVPRRIGRRALAAGGLVIVLVAVTVARPAISDAWDQFRNVKQATVSSTDPAARLTNLNGARYQHWKSALNAFDAHPLDGIGAGTFEFWYSRHGGVEFIRDAHSLYFESLAELGLVGFALVVALLGGLLYAALRRRRHVDDTAGLGLHTALVAAFLVFVVDAGVDWMWETTAVGALALGGIAVAGTRRRHHREPRRLSRGMSEIERRKVLELRRARLAQRVGIPVVGAVTILLAIPGLAGTSLIRKSQAAYRAGDMSLALTRADDAVRAEPWSADAYMQRGVVFEAGDSLAAAAADMHHAIAREPLNWRPQLLLARIEAERGDVRAALAAFREVKRLRPKSIYVQG